MKWEQEEIKMLFSILEQVRADIEPLPGKRVLVLCSAAGDVAFYLSARIGQGEIIGLELGDELLEYARERTRQRRLEKVVRFQKAEMERIPFPDETFDALVSEFIVFPTPTPTQIGQPEMARILKPGGKMILTDVIVTKPIPQGVRDSFQSIGLDYLCDATTEDFHNEIIEAGLTNVDVLDFTPVVRRVWEQRRAKDLWSEHRKGYGFLLDDPEFKLGNAVFYIYARGKKAAG